MFLREVPELYVQIRTCCNKYTYSWYCGVHTKDSKANRHSINTEEEEVTFLED